MSPANDLLYVANPSTPLSCRIDRWGLDIIEPDSPDKGFPYWENLSWENADKYQPDVLMFDKRQPQHGHRPQDGALAATWTSIRAAKADQIVERPGFWLHTYGHFATALDTLREAVGLDDSIGD